MLGNLRSNRSSSPISTTMSEGALENNRAEKALITKTPDKHEMFMNKTKNYSDKNGNDVTKFVNKGRKTFAFWTLMCLLFVLAIGNLVLTFTILSVLRLGRGMESMEFLPDHNAMKLFGDTFLEHVYKRDGLLESYRDTPLSVTSEDGSVVFNLQTRLSRAETKLTVNSSGVFIRGVNSLELVDPDSGDRVFSTNAPEIMVPEAINNLHAKKNPSGAEKLYNADEGVGNQLVHNKKDIAISETQISTKRITSPTDEDLLLRSESSAYLRGAEGTNIESKELHWSADQDIYLKSINGSIVLSGKEGVYIDVRYLPIAMVTNKTESGTGQFKVCVCMPQGKLFRIAVPNGQRVTCSHVNMTGDLNPCV